METRQWIWQTKYSVLIRLTFGEIKLAAAFVYTAVYDIKWKTFFHVSQDLKHQPLVFHSAQVPLDNRNIV